MTTPLPTSLPPAGTGLPNAPSRVLPARWPNNPWPTRFRTVRMSDPELTPPGVRLLTINSPALGGRGELALFVPPEAEALTDVPIVVLLHGVYGSFWNWLFNGAAHLLAGRMIADGELAPMVLVMPSDGLVGEGTAYLDRPVAAERWIMGDVVDAAIEALPCLSARSPLLLGGLSMGAFGALRLGGRYPQRVTAVAALSTVPTLAVLDEFLAAPLTLDPDTAATSLAATLVGAGDDLPALWLTCGEADPLLGCNRELHADFERLGITHHYGEAEGGHDWAFWRRQLPAALRHFDTVLNDVTRRTAPHRSEEITDAAVQHDR